MEKPIYLTKNGLEKFQAELEYLKRTKRSEIAKELREVVTFCHAEDIDTEYLEIKNQQGFTEGRIRQLEILLANTILLEPKSASGSIELGSTVIVIQEGFEKETFTIVGTVEANPKENQISDESPFGKALLGKSKGDLVEVFTPKGNVNLHILAIK